jgi:type VI secretion system protein ImpL
MKLLGAFAGWVLALVLMTIVFWATALYVGWPWWSALVMLFGVLGVYVLYRLLRRLLVAASMRSAIVSAQLDMGLGPSAGSEALSTQSVLKRRWKLAVNTLRRSSLRRYGNPLDVLPWYLMVGRSGAGKTTALTRARLTSAIQQVDHNGPIDQTANCEWWYFDDAVVVDCAGRYVESEGLEEDRAEWDVLLDQLARYRSPEGINGLVLTIDARRLQQPDGDGLVKEAKVLRERIEQLIRLFDKRFPIYVLVTQCDHVYGWEDWSGRLEPGSLDHAMGYLASQGESGFIDRAFERIGKRLGLLRLKLATQAQGATPALLMFVSELENLKAGLQIYLEECFSDQPYRESPFLRGLFFSSGAQSGGAVSTLLPGVLPPVTPHDTSDTGLFLHHFFGRILPKDRKASLPTALVNRWWRATRHLGLLAWVVTCIAMVVLMGAAFEHRLTTVQNVRQTYPLDAGFTGKIDDDAKTLDRIDAALEVVARRNANWVGQWMVATSEIGVLESRLRRSYIATYRRYIQHAVDEAFDEVNPDSTLTAQELRAGRIHNLVRSIQAMKRHSAGDTRGQLAALPPILPVDPTSTSVNESLRLLGHLSVSYIAWLPDDNGALENRLVTAQTRLGQSAYAGQPVLSWVLDLPTNASLGEDVTMASFWQPLSTVGKGLARGKSVPDANDVRVSVAFTAAGKHAIDNFMDDMATSVLDRPKFEQARRAFDSWYSLQRANAWYKFATHFPSGERLLAGESEWRSTLARASIRQDPFALLIGRLDEEFKDARDDQLPHWLLLARTLSRLQRELPPGTTLASGKAAMVFNSINAVGGRMLRRVATSLPMGNGTLQQDLTLRSGLRDYGASMDAVMRVGLGGAAKAYSLAAEFHLVGVDPQSKPSRLLDAVTSLQDLRRPSGFDDPESAVIWKLKSGPLHLLLSYVGQQASCLVQQDWESNVVWPLQTATSMTQITEQLFGTKGSVWAFANGTGKPFVRREASRFSLIETLGYTLPVTPEFLPMLNGAVNKQVGLLAAQQQLELAQRTRQVDVEKLQLESTQALQTTAARLVDGKQQLELLRGTPIELSITAQPMGVNREATAKPFLTTLTLHCGAVAKILNNYNFAAVEQWTWSPAQCSGVSLEIKISDLTLVKRYAGAMGMADFVTDFRTGTRDFSGADFPQSRARLEALLVEKISVRYDFQGQDALLQAAAKFTDLTKEQLDLSTEMKRLSSRQLGQAQSLVEIRAPGSQSEPSLQVFVPPRIAACWSTSSRSHSPQTLKAMFDALIAPVSTR